MFVANRSFAFTAALIAAGALFLPSSAAAQSLYGAASISSARDCSTTASTDPCDGSGPGQVRIATDIEGGPSRAATATVALPDGSFATGTGTFGALDLPLIKEAADSVGDVRMNANVIAYQGYRYVGPSGTPFSLGGDLHFLAASSSPDGAALPDGAGFSAYIGIWDPSVVAAMTSADDILRNLFFAPCGTPGVLAVGSLSGTLTGGGSFSMTTTSCSGSPLLLTPGEQLLAIAGLQLPTNRGGYADASSTFTVTLDPSLSPGAIANLTSGLQSAMSVPEPGSWSLMLLGFAAIGLAVRSRRHRLPARILS